MGNYIFEFTMLYAFCGISYLILSRSAGPRLLRRFIVGSLTVSILLPLAPAFVEQGSQILTIKLPEVLVSSSGSSPGFSSSVAAEAFSFFQIFGGIFTLVSLFVLVRLIASSIKLMTIISHSTIEQTEGRKLIFSSKVNNPCSFFNYILLPKYYEFDQDELDIVIRHEEYHIKYFHSFEKVALEITHIFLWWHPVHYLFRSQLSLVHEYEVDQAMLLSIEPKTYKSILLQIILNPPALRITNPFSTNIKQRIMKLNKQQKKSNIPVLSSTLMLMLCGMLLIHACTSDEVLNANQSKSKSSMVSDTPAPPGPPSAPEAPPSPLLVTDTIITFDMETKTEKKEIVSSIMEVYKTPEVMPIFPGCTDTEKKALKECSTNKLLQFVYKNIVYPSEARDNQVEGMVVTSFIINKNGEIQNSKILRTPDPRLEQPVLDMLDKMRDEILWIPGKQQGEDVSVEYTLPVRFKLEG